MEEELLYSELFFPTMIKKFQKKKINNAFACWLVTTSCLSHSWLGEEALFL
jgi:hypothetical protein